MQKTTLTQVIEAVQQGKGYEHIHPELVTRIATQEIAKGRGFKNTVKATRTMLHQVGGAYLPHTPPYAEWEQTLAGLSSTSTDPDLQAYCLEKMQYHASTRERLPFLESFYSLSLGNEHEIESLLDLACGLNPLAIPWLPMKPGAAVYLCDIFQDMLEFVDTFRRHLGYAGHSRVCDLTESIPDTPIQVALLLKTIPCLEQLQKNIGGKILEGIRAETLIVTYPVASLGGRSKGMRQTYRARFAELVEGKPWHIQTLEIGSELVFIIRK